jgi:MFS family permease
MMLHQVNRNERLFILQGMVGFSAGTLTTGVFLTGFLLLLDASTLTIGLLTSAGSWALLISLVSSFLVERVRHRRRLLVSVLMGFRLLTTLPVFLPAFLGFERHTATIAAVMIIAGYVLNTINTTDLPVFMMDSIPAERREDFVYTRMMYIRIANTVLMLVAGSVLDFFERRYAGFVVMFSLALLAGLLEVSLLLGVRGESVVRHNGIQGTAFLRQLSAPLKNRRYRQFLLFTLGYFFFHFAAMSYIPLYQYQTLELGYLPIMLYNTAIFILMILLTRVWAHVEKRIGQMRVLVLSAALLSMDFLLYGFLTKGTLWLLPISVVIAGMGGAGFWACILPYRYNMMPRDGKSIYEAWNGTFFAVAGLLGALFGGKIQEVLPACDIGPIAFSPFQMVFLLCGCFSLVSVLVFAGTQPNTRVTMSTKRPAEGLCVQPSLERGKRPDSENASGG